MCFLFLFLGTFFSHQTYAGARKKCPKKKKRWLSVPDYLTDKWHTKLSVQRSHSFVYVLPNNDRINSFQSPRKFDFSWYLTSLRGQRTCSNLQPKRSSKTSLLSAESTFDDFNRKDLGFWFQWPDSVTRLLPPNSCKRALRCFQSFGECAWMAIIMLFRIMVWDVHPIIYLHLTTEKENVLLPPRNNREEIATSTQSSLQVKRASVARMTLTVNSPDFVILIFFFGFQPKATRAGESSGETAIPTRVLIEWVSKIEWRRKRVTTIQGTVLN